MLEEEQTGAEGAATPPGGHFKNSCSSSAVLVKITTKISKKSWKITTKRDQITKNSAKKYDKETQNQHKKR